MCIIVDDAKSYGVKLSTNAPISPNLPFNFGAAKEFTLCRAHPVARGKFQSNGLVLPPHTSAQVAGALQSGGTTSAGHRIHLNPLGNRDYRFKALVQKFIHANSAHREWFREIGWGKGKRSGFSIIQGHHVRSIDHETTHLLGKLPTEHDLKWTSAGCQATVNPAELLHTEMPIIVQVYAATISCDAGISQDKCQNFSCRVSFTFPREGTLIAIGPTAASIRVHPTRRE